jgi:hypothetical protein
MAKDIPANEMKTYGMSEDDWVSQTFSDGRNVVLCCSRPSSRGARRGKLPGADEEFGRHVTNQYYNP